MSFTQGVSGLKAASSGLDTIGNNIANSQTVGFKSGRTEFADLYAGAKTGLGVTVADTSQNFSSGSLDTTGRNLDLAIDGGGFFRLANGNRTVYSRDGQFQQTKEGYLANSSGALLTGYNVSGLNNPNGTPQIATGGTPQTIQLPSTGLNARGTTQSSAQVSLDAGAPIKSAAAVKVSDPTTYNWSTPSTVYDSLGNAHSLNLYFTKTASNTWQIDSEMPLGKAATFPTTVDATATYPGGITPAASGNGTYQFTVGSGSSAKSYTARVSGATQNSAGGPYSGGSISYTETLASNQLQFDSSGNLSTTTPINYSLDAQNGSAPINFSLDFRGSSQTAQSFAANSLNQDGYAPGALVGVSIEGNGNVSGTYSNGQKANLAQIALAGFGNEQGLKPVSGNAWEATATSGQALVGQAGTGQLGSLRGGTLEKSNVDLSQQLVNMIVAQRNYQANAQTIKTQSQVLQTAVNLQ
ncbi:MAG: flagellar hook protein FlgE [Salinisphaera sp.]|jgi:flagellar hook protein FlgE|nr:flagellar hook protein FlgE [Salinisphaera sp.]